MRIGVLVAPSCHEKLGTSPWNGIDERKACGFDGPPRRSVWHLLGAVALLEADHSFAAVRKLKGGDVAKFLTIISATSGQSAADTSK